jgi:hypothetical protein
VLFQDVLKMILVMTIITLESEVARCQLRHRVHIESASNPDLCVVFRGRARSGLGGEWAWRVGAAAAAAHTAIDSKGIGGN